MDIKAQVERQINEQSNFSPIQWLMDGGRLMYSDYERWRKGETPFLDVLLLGDLKKIVLQLENAMEHAELLGMKREEANFTSWQQNTPSQLRASKTPALNQLLTCRFIRVNDTPQLDLFFDNPVLFTENGLRDALGSRDLDQTQRLLNQLSEQDPNHKHLHHFESLAAYLGHMSQALNLETKMDTAKHTLQITEELEGLENVIEPLAKDCLQDQARDYLIPAWRRLAFSLEGIPFDSNMPKLHASYAWQKALDWPETKKKRRGRSDI